MLFHTFTCLLGNFWAGEGLIWSGSGVLIPSVFIGSTWAANTPEDNQAFG